MAPKPAIRPPELYVSELTVHLHKNVPPRRGGTLTSYQLFCSEHAATRSRGTGRGMPLPRATLRSREREGKAFPAPRPAVGKGSLHTREAPRGGGAHKRQGQDHKRSGDVCQHARNTTLKQPALKVRGDVAPNTPQQDAHTDDAWDIEQ